jgi:hypothetical protein
MILEFLQEKGSNTRNIFKHLSNSFFMELMPLERILEENLPEGLEFQGRVFGDEIALGADMNRAALEGQPSTDDQAYTQEVERQLGSDRADAEDPPFFRRVVQTDKFTIKYEIRPEKQPAAFELIADEVVREFRGIESLSFECHEAEIRLAIDTEDEQQRIKIEPEGGHTLEYCKRQERYPSNLFASLAALKGQYAESRELIAQRIYDAIIGFIEHDLSAN